MRPSAAAAWSPLALPVGVVAARMLTAVPGYGRTRRGTIALQGFSRLALRTLGIRVLSQGSPRSGPSLVAANHVCWLDVLVLAAAGPIVPLVDESVLQRHTGPMAIRFGAMFLRPGASRDLSETVHRVTSTLRSGHRVLVFPDRGRMPLNGAGAAGGRGQFSGATFQAAVDAAVVISPVTLSYDRPPAASTELDLFGSLWRILRSGPLTVRVTWLPVIPAVAGPGHRAGHRAAAARRTEWAIDGALGRHGPAPSAPRSVVAPEQVPALALAS